MLRARRARDPPEAGRHGRKAVHGVWGAQERPQGRASRGHPPHGAAEGRPPKPQKMGKKILGIHKDPYLRKMRNAPNAAL